MAGEKEQAMKEQLASALREIERLRLQLKVLEASAQTAGRCLRVLADEIRAARQWAAGQGPRRGDDWSYSRRHPY